jgi:hypothetical protein
LEVFQSTSGSVGFVLTGFECELLGSLVTQLGTLVSGSGQLPEDGDAFAKWQQELSGLSPMDFSDPAVARLFPDAYRDDPVAASEFLRLTETERRLELIRAVNLVLADVSDAPETAGGHRVQLPPDHLAPWLKAVNALRLTLSVRLGVQSQADVDALESLSPQTPQGYLYQLYQWLALLIECLVTSSP